MTQPTPIELARDTDMIPVRRGLMGAVNAILKRTGMAGTNTAKEFIPLAMSSPARNARRRLARNPATAPRS